MSKKMIALNAAVLTVILSVGVLYFTGISRIVNYVVSIDSDRIAMNWTADLKNAISNMDALIATGLPTEAQSVQINAAASVGDIFRFKLFDAEGRNVLISDELSNALEPGARTDHNGNAARVLATGKNIISLNDGTQKANRPPLYVEAYVPLKNADGDNLGVIEVYIDQTAIYNLFLRSFTILAVALAGVFFLAFGAPYAGFLYKNYQEEKARKRSVYLANFDQLTNLLNRHGFMAQLNERGGLTETDSNTIGVIFLDVDHFKNINDSHGHSAGDAFLKHLGDGITKNLQQGDIAARFGGDEFVIVLQRDNFAEIQKFIENISAAASSPLIYEGTTIIGNISVGVHYAADNDDDTGIFSVETRMQKADLALYRAKQDGRNTSCTFTDDLETTLNRRKFVEAEILSALEKNNFELYFQPILHHQTLKCTGFEALARIRTTEDKIIPAGEFAPIADSMGKMGEISTWALHEAISAASEWPTALTVAVNVDSRQLQDHTLVAQINNVLAQTGYDPRNLLLEINESLLLQNTTEVLSQLKDIRKLGVLLAIDNFGTGHSNLSHMWRFEFDKLKIDRSFVTEINAKNSRVSEVLNTIITLAHRLNMEVIAGGVETNEQAQLLEKLSCDYLQGYLHAKPMPASDIADYLHNNFIQQNKPASPKTSRKAKRAKA